MHLYADLSACVRLGRAVGTPESGRSEGREGTAGENIKFNTSKCQVLHRGGEKRGKGIEIPSAWS